MTDGTRRMTLELEFEAALGEVTRALRAEGLGIFARIDMRDEIKWSAGREFPRCFLLEICSTDFAVDVLECAPDLAPSLPTTVAVYELGDGRTAAVAREPLWPDAEDPVWRTRHPALAAGADRETARLARALDAMAGGVPRHRDRQVHHVPHDARDQ